MSFKSLLAFGLVKMPPSRSLIAIRLKKSVPVLGPKRTSKCEEFAYFFGDSGVFLRSYLEATPFAQKLLTRNKSWPSTCIYDSGLAFDLHKRIALENYFAIVVTFSP